MYLTKGYIPRFKTFWETRIQFTMMQTLNYNLVNTMSNNWKQRIRATTLIPKMCNRDQILNKVLTCAMSQNNESDLQSNYEYRIFDIWPVSDQYKYKSMYTILETLYHMREYIVFKRKYKFLLCEELSTQTLGNTGSLSDSNFPHASALTRTEVRYCSVMMSVELIYFRRHSNIEANFHANSYRK